MQPSNRIHQPLRVAICGGETGGHLHPAAAIADHIKAESPESRCLYVGAAGRMQMAEVFRGEHETASLKIGCLNRRHPGRNLFLPIEFATSIWQSLTIIRRFAPHVVVSVGGFPSGPFLFAAWLSRVPILILEPNAAPGLTHSLLRRLADRVCVGFAGMDRWFRQESICQTGVPFKHGLFAGEQSRELLRRRYQLVPGKPILVITGGSLGSTLLNETVMANRPLLGGAGIQVLWQTGADEFNRLRTRCQGESPGDIRMVPYVDGIESLFAIADLVITAAGAITLSELALLGTPAIVVPTPDSTENHQLKNALRWKEAGGCEVVLPEDVPGCLIPFALRLMRTPARLDRLRQGILRNARPDSNERIAGEIHSLAWGFRS